VKAEAFMQDHSKYNKMNLIWIYALSSVLIVSFLSFIGIILLLFNTQPSKKNLLYFVSFSVGGLLGGAFLHLLPESIESLGTKLSMNYLLLGILTSFIIEMFLKWRHCHVPTSDDHPHTFAYMNLIGDGVHNLIDGIVIGASYLTSIKLGLASTLAICLHEIPQEIGDFGVLLYAGYEKKKAILFNFISALAALLGLIISLTINAVAQNIVYMLLPFAAGNFVYIAGSDLVPELHDEKELSRSLVQLIAIFLGLALLYFIE
jgi:zinc and cadmium transporter